jgi:hypothetical protein
LIKSLEPVGHAAPSHAAVGGALREGMKVEARYRGKARYYPGVIRRENRDGTFDIDYDDGEKEMFVAAELIKALEPAGSGSPSRLASTSQLRAISPVKDSPWKKLSNTMSNTVAKPTTPEPVKSTARSRQFDFGTSTPAKITKRSFTP